MPTYADLWNESNRRHAGGSSAFTSQTSRQGPVTIYIDDEYEDANGGTALPSESMDVDLERRTAQTETIRYQSRPISSSVECRVVVDTNVLMSQLPLMIDAVHALSADSAQWLKFVVPFVVLRELDHLKDFSEANTDPQKQVEKHESALLARKAVKWLLDLLRENCTHVMLQLDEDAAYGRDQLYVNSRRDARSDLREGNDDLVLGACRKVSEESYSVRLLTNDRGLILKASAFEIRCISTRTITRGVSLLRVIKQDLGDTASATQISALAHSVVDVNDMDLESRQDESLSEMDTTLQLALLIVEYLHAPLRTHCLRTFAKDDEDVMHYMVPELDVKDFDRPCDVARQIMAVLRRLWVDAEISNLYRWDLRPGLPTQQPREAQSIFSVSAQDRLQRGPPERIKDTLLSLEGTFRRWTPKSNLSLGDKLKLINDVNEVLLGNALLSVASRIRVKDHLERLI